MQIEQIRIENFRSFKDQVITLDDYTSFVGPNGAGKSTILHALNLFFRQSKDSQTDLTKLTADDFHHNNIADPIKITVTFHQLSEQATSDLSDYVRQDKLVITAIATYDAVQEMAKVRQFGNRLGMEEFRTYFEADKEGKKATELKAIFKTLKEKYPEINSASSKGDMEAALHEFESNNESLCNLIPSEDQFYGVSRGVNRLEPHLQWIFVPATKDASEEGQESAKSALGQLLGRTVRSQVNFDESIRDLRNNVRVEYQKLLDAEQTVLDQISTSLEQRLASWSHPDISASVKWQQDPEKSVKIEQPLASLKITERGFEGDLSRFGHGLQRSYMLALLQELTLFDLENQPTLIMGIEEPELYQHPPQARYLAETLFELSESDSQIVLCTHSPLFIPGDSFDKVRLVKEIEIPSQTIVKYFNYSELATLMHEAGEKLVKEEGMIAKLYPSLNPVVNEMFFCKVLVLVEGHEDLAHLTTYMMLNGKLEEFRKYGCHIVPVEGKSKMIKPLAMAKLLSIPTLIVFDLDTDSEQIPNEQKRESAVTKHKKDNKALLTLKDYSSDNEWSNNDIVKPDLIAWTTNLTKTIKDELGSDYDEHKNKALADYGNIKGLQKNPLAIARSLKYAWDSGVRSAKLIDITDKIIEFAKTNTTA